MKSSLSLFRSLKLNNFIIRYASNEVSLGTDFEKAKSRLESSSTQVDNETKLKLYGLYKQATQGICATTKPGLTDFIGRAKWTAWSSLGKMNQQDAQKQYIQVIEQLISSSTSNDKIDSNAVSKNEETKSVKDQSTTEHIELIKKSSLHWEIVLNRPEKYNAITRPMYERIIEILDQAGQDKELVLLTMTGKGKFYSAGTDLADFAKMATSTSNLKQSVELGQTMLEKFVGKYIDFPKILIGFINGPAVGISVSTLGLFDGVYASSGATFSLPFTRTAQSAEGCSSFIFPSLMGSLHAKDILLFDRKLTAEEAQQRGLVTKIIDEKFFLEEKDKICQQILSLPKGSLLTSKSLIQKWTKETLHRVNTHEVETLKQRWLTEEFVQAMMEFMRGRKKN
ncbi:unnamed protein product [Rotaria socialis]|uniref:ACB domain-containing protein n=1 Tax=Rotaria socialis TaxID=392032 RepID=A0A820VE51_9BILA|nr:unnamed protein product [Rotaria socialis]CAF3327120.1 unnamed protein product [Rotaria socialis]CAF3365413.1 unnamed protein product [Rotaria socialis]CAF3444770.1 unnamed protein product [Rotaria socialis]CAF3560923.1 unnamed protein product [Rotaria socialis]